MFGQKVLTYCRIPPISNVVWLMYLEFNLPWRADTISWGCPPLGLARGSSCKSKVLSTSRPVLGVSIITYKSLVPVPQKQGCHLRFCWKKHVSSVGLEETGMGRQKRSFETTVVIICIVFYVLIFLCILYIYINMFSFTATSVEKGLGSEKLNNLPQVSQGLDGSTGTWRQALCPHSPTAMPWCMLSGLPAPEPGVFTSRKGLPDRHGSQPWG